MPPPTTTTRSNSTANWPTTISAVSFVPSTLSRPYMNAGIIIILYCHSNPQCDNSMSLGQRTNVPDTDTISFLYAYCEEERIMTVDLCIDVVRFLTCQKNCNYCQRRWRRQQGNCDCSCICICIFICLYLSNVSQQWHQHNKSTNCCKLCWRH